jgi:hypothetical protein
MNNSFASTTLLSFYQWLDNRILTAGTAYTNTTSRLYYRPDPQLGSSYVTYQAPFKSFVWDSGVSNATILTSISGNFGNLSRGQSGMMVDYENGRVILPAAFGVNKIVSGSYSFKDFNIYFANQSQEEIIFTDKYYLNSRFNRLPTQIPPANAMVTPAIFISLIDEENKNHAFGGVYNSSILMGVTVLTDNLEQLEGALSILVDSKEAHFPSLPAADWPLNAYGDWKSGYNYNDKITEFGQPGNQYTIETVMTSKVGDGEPMNESIFAGIAYVRVEKPRTIH